MVISVRAIYEQGRLRPLEPINLAEGEEVNVNILPTEQELTRDEAIARLRAAGVLVEYTDDDFNDDDLDLSEDEIDELGRLFLGDRPSDELIDEGRGPHF